VNRLARLLVNRPRLLVLVHDNPDPDAMAGALCLSHLIEALSPAKARIVYGGIVGRADNRNMVRALGIPLWSMESIKVRPDDAFALVDTQPGFANNSLPPDGEVLAVIDHHERGPQPGVPLVDVRPRYGAVSSILAEYLISARVEVTARLATAVCYAIGTETQDLGREARPADIAALMEFFPLANQPLLGRLRHPRHSLSFFAGLDRAIRAAQAAEGVLVCHLGRLAAPDGASEIAELLATSEDVRWVLCTGLYQDKLVLSLRTDDYRVNAGQILRRIVGQQESAGGHGVIAGGAIPIPSGEDPAQLQTAITRRFLVAIGRDETAGLKPLLEPPGPLSPEEPAAQGGRPQ
jgi:nanoRNase/pAp phosphatase (c-di-AMP/oligoRNAs hydrolase)